MYLGHTFENPGETKFKMITSGTGQLVVRCGICKWLPCASKRAYVGALETEGHKVVMMFAYAVSDGKPLFKHVYYKTPVPAEQALKDLETTTMNFPGSFNWSVKLSKDVKWYQLALHRAPDPPDYVEPEGPDCLTTLQIGLSLRGKEFVNYQLASAVWKIFKKQGLNDDSEKFYWQVLVQKGQSDLGPNMVVVNGSSGGYDTREECLKDMTDSAGYEDGFDITKGE